MTRVLQAFMVVACLSGPARPAAAADRALPTPPAGWRLEVVAAAPRVRHPSVVCAAPDGRVFVAEDPMDISTPRANAALGRVLCFHPDGSVSTFADKLYAVFGMQYLDGRLYVLHNPRFSVFADGGTVGTGRTDLIESTNPDPWALNWNDHVPANFRLAMDGYLYVAVGDKGVYGAVGADGKRVDLHGGGVLRLRPDGSGLEVYCTGVRNILDVAVNDEDEIFTYDNTDEQQWMSRLTHMVDGGSYGYPYDFIPQRPYTLWRMADYGGGAATGALAYNEDALPPEYHGNLFLADFAKRQVLRVRVERQGGSYKAVSHQELFADVPPDFRPVGISLDPEGMGLYICDWAHADTKEEVEVGRLLKLSYAGESRAAAKPAWYVPAATGRAFDATVEEFVQALSHPSHAVRMVAQRRIAERGAGAVELLNALLANAAAPSHTRRHAVWALDAIDGGAAGRSAVLAAAAGGEVSVRRQAIRQLGARQVAEAADAFVSGLADSDASVRFQSAAACGRLGDPAAVPALLAALDQEDLFARYAAFTALNRIGRARPTAWAAIADGLRSEKPRVREGVTFAVRETFDVSLVAVLAAVARDETAGAPAREAALRVMGGLHRKTPEWKGEWWAYHPVNAPPPAKSVDWAGTEAVLASLRRGLDDRAAEVRVTSVDGLREAKDAGSAPRVRELFRRETDARMRRAALAALGAFKDAAAGELIASTMLAGGSDVALRTEAVAAAEQIGGPELAAAIVTLLAAPEPDEPELLRRAAEAAGNLKLAEAVPHLAGLARRGEERLRAAAFAAVIKVGGDLALTALAPLLDDSSADVRRGAVAALGGLKAPAALPRLLEAYRDPETRQAAISALAQTPDVRAMDAYLEGLAAKDWNVRERSKGAIRAVRDAALPLLEAKAGLKAKAGGLPPEVLAALQEVYKDSGPARRGPIFAAAAAAREPGEYLDFALRNGGDPKRGGDLFGEAAGIGCAKCHAVAGRGGTVGPDLSDVGAKYARKDLAEGVLFPSKAVREGYQQIIVRTKKGDVYAGPLKTESAEELVLHEADGNLRRIPKSEVRDRKNSGLSPMPEGLHAGLSLQEFADLVSYLESLKTEPAPAGKE